MRRNELATRKIKNIRYPAEDWSLNTILSADFADAYTQSELADLQKAIKKLGGVLRWSFGKISLSNKLAALVFNNCYFETPNGIHRQSRGFPRALLRHRPSRPGPRASHKWGPPTFLCICM